MQGRTNGCRWSAEGISEVHTHCKMQQTIELLTLFLVRPGGLYFAGPWGVAGLGSTNWLAISSTWALVPHEVFSLPLNSLFLGPMSVGAVTRPSFAQRLELLWALPRWDLWHFNRLIVCLFMSKLHFIPKAQHTATSLMKESHLLNDLFPLCCYHPRAGRDDVVPPQFSHQCTVLAEFLHTSFLASSVNDSLTIFHLFLTCVVG